MSDKSFPLPILIYRADYITIDAYFVKACLVELDIKTKRSCKDHKIFFHK